jgi:Cof subfamily protein (haloacid dehalogenase superfamily)
MIASNIKMIVTDLDRTLLRTDKSISEYTSNIFAKCREKGIKILFATARPIRVTKLFLLQIPCEGVIYHNGAVIYYGDEHLKSISIPISDTRQILFSLAKHISGIKLSVEIDDFLYANFDITEHWDNTFAKQTDFTDLPNKNADKIIASISNLDDIKIIEKYLPDYLYIEMSDNKLGLIMHKQATKLNGLKAVIEKLNLSLKGVIAFGDDYNDIEMIKACGIGVAVENAIDEVKCVADFIAFSNDNDGVARFIENFFEL